MKKSYDFKYKLSLKCVLIGDTGVGKSCLATRLCHHNFPEEYVPTLFDNFAVTVFEQQNPYNLSIFDTAGQEMYSRLRVLSYANCDVFLVIFDVTNPDSLQSVKNVWIPEIRQHKQTTPIILVGSKIDARKPKDKQSIEKKDFVSSKEGSEASAELGAMGYVECSALTGEGMDAVSQKVVAGFLQSAENRKEDEKTTPACCSCAIL